MILKSFGCSFIFGTDLHDDGRDLRWPTPSQHTWPALIAKKRSWDYKCHARGGSGNIQILERVLTQAALNEPAFFVIGWTWIDRFDYTSGNRDAWSTVMPIDTDEKAKIYYRDLHSQFRDKFTSLCAIKTAIDTLKQKNLPFLMTYMDDLIFETEWHTTPAITDLQNYIRPHVTNFEGRNFVEWSRNQGFEISPTMHPLEPAHAAAAELMNPMIKL